MSFTKESQSLDGVDLDLDGFDHNSVEDLVLVDDDLSDLRMDQEDLLLQIEEEPDGDLVLTLDKVPGALDQDDLEETLEVEEPEEVQVEDDPWSWGSSLSNFLPWLSKMMQNCPQHSGRDTAGLERAIAYFERLDTSISKAVRLDFNNEISIDALEKARDEIQRGLDRLRDRLEKVKSTKYRKGKKKKSDAEYEGLVKEAQKATHVGGIVVSVPLFISYLARTCINGMVSAGHDIEDMFVKLSKKFDLTSREKAELVQLLQDMNYPVRRDRGFLLDEEIDTSSSDNFDWAANYPA